MEDIEGKFKAEQQKRMLVEKKFNYDSSNDAELLGVGGSVRWVYSRSVNKNTLF